MSSTSQGRAGLTTQLPIPFFLEIAELAESLGVARHKLALMALRAGLDTAVEQIRAEQATEAAQQPRAAGKELSPWMQKETRTKAGIKVIMLAILPHSPPHRLTLSRFPPN